VTAYNGKTSGRAIRRIVAKGESNPTPLLPDDKSLKILKEVRGSGRKYWDSVQRYIHVTADYQRG